MNDRYTGIVTGLALVSLIVAAPRLAWSHAADAMLAPPGSVVIAPRAEARVGQVEMVAMFSKQIFAVFLSRYADGAPVTAAKVEASTDLQSAELTETDPGVYSTTELLMAAGQNAVAITFHVGDVVKTQSVALTLPSEVTALAVSQSAVMTAGSVTIAGAVLALAGLVFAAFLLVRRRLPARVLAHGHAERNVQGI